MLFPSVSVTVRPPPMRSSDRMPTSSGTVTPTFALISTESPSPGTSVGSQLALAVQTPVAPEPIHL